MFRHMFQLEAEGGEKKEKLTLKKIILLKLTFCMAFFVETNNFE